MSYQIPGITKVSIDVEEKEPWYKRPVSSTIGRASSPLTALALGSQAPLGRTASGKEDFVKKLLAAAQQDKDIDKQIPLKVNFGGVHPLETLTRTWKNPRTSILTKLLGTATQPINQALATLSRGDHYNPFSHEVTSYTADPAVVAHELGHAQDFSKAENPGIYTLTRMLPLSALSQEYTASKNAIKLLRKARMAKEISRANRVLGGGLGSYAGSMAGVGPIPGALVGQAVGAGAEPFN